MNAGMSLPSAARFVLGETLALEESRTLEFKEVTSSHPVNAIANAADEYAVAFLNGDGGAILWGVRDIDHVVVGVALPLGERDRLRQLVLGKLHAIQPSIDPTQFRLELHPVQDAPAERHLMIVELIVPAGEHVDPFHTASGEVFVRVEGVKKKLTITQLAAWVRNRAALPAQFEELIASRNGTIRMLERISRDVIVRVRSSRGLWYEFNGAFDPPKMGEALKISIHGSGGASIRVPLKEVELLSTDWIKPVLQIPAQGTEEAHIMAMLNHWRAYQHGVDLHLDPKNEVLKQLIPFASQVCIFMAQEGWTEHPRDRRAFDFFDMHARRFR